MAVRISLCHSSGPSNDSSEVPGSDHGNAPSTNASGSLLQAASQASRSEFNAMDSSCSSQDTLRWSLGVRVGGLMLHRSTLRRGRTTG